MENYWFNQKYVTTLKVFLKKTSGNIQIKKYR